MKHYAGIDVSLNSSSVCVVDESGKIVREVKVASEPVALIHCYQIARCEVGADRAGSRPAVAMAVRGVAGERAAGGASGDAAREGSALGDAGENGSQ